MLQIVGIIAALGAIVVIGVLGYAATVPDTFRVQRSIAIMAPPETIFPLINELKRFNEWNPFVKPDPTLTITYSGPAAGKGAAHAWDSSGRAGRGRLEITDCIPPSQITMRLDMIKPMEGRHIIVFALQPQADGNDVRTHASTQASTAVSWAMTGRYPYIAKVIGLFFSMDRMIGGEFDKGLAHLKAMAESA